MALQVEKKTEVISKYRSHENDTGSCGVQVALLTERISQLTQHFDKHVKDSNSRRGLLKMVGRRRKLLNYLRKNNSDEYKKLIDSLGIRK